MIAALVLAGGRSRRMGTQKLLLPYAGTTMLEHIVETLLHPSLRLLPTPIDRVVVVTGHDPRPAAALAGRPVTLVANPDPEGDMLSSVRCGLRALPPECRAVLLALGDQPALTPELVATLLNAFAAGGQGLLVPTHAGRRGHPLLFSARYIPEILAGCDATGLRGLLQAHPTDLREFPVETPAVLQDLDTPDDYRQALH